MMKIKLASIIKGIFLLELILLTYLEFQYFGNALKIYKKNTMVLQILVCSIALIMILYTFRKSMKVRKSIISGLILCLSIFVSSILFSNGSFTNAEYLSVLLKTTYWFLIFLFGYCMSKNFNDLKLPNNIMVCLLIIFIIRYLGSMQFNYTIVNKDYTVTAIYYLVCLAPFLFGIQSKRIKFILATVMLIMVLISFKRSAVIVVLIALSVLIIENKNDINFKRLTTILISIITLICICALVYFFINESINFDFDSIFRVWNYRLNSSSGRLAIYREVLFLFFNSNLLNVLLGHGQNAVISISSLGLSAHNDFLEILFNYGLIGFISFVVFIIYLFREKKNIKRKCDKNIYNGYVFSLIVFLLASIPSHMLTYGTYFLFLALFMGMAIGAIKNNE